MKAFKQNAKLWKESWNTNRENLEKLEMIALVAEKLNRETKKLVERSHSTVLSRRRTANASTLKSLEDRGSDIMRKQTAASEFYSFVSELKVRLGVDDGKSTLCLETRRPR